MEAASAAEARSFGKYDLVAKLATGGMAEIFLARLLSDGGFEKLVCIKRILPHLAKDPQFVAMFLDEARVVARISHPNVCQVFELGEISNQYYIAMEYLAGVPLSCFRRTDFYSSPPESRLVAGVGVQACEGLHHAHQLKRPDGNLLGVVHRDISPQNLFVTVDGIVKLLDFGIAKVQDQTVRTSTGAMKGTYCYMAPEQLRGESIDRRSDVWALGTVLWETLAQRHLFKRETEFLTFQAITADPIPDISELRPDVPPLLADAIGRAISRNRDDRFPTARAFGEALAQAVGALGGPLQAAGLSDEVARAFDSTLHEQRVLIEMARAGDTFDLERSNPLVGHGSHLSATPVSNLHSKVAAAQAEVAHYVAMQQALEGLDDGGMGNDGAFMPAPGRRAQSPAAEMRRSQQIGAQPQRRSQPIPRQSQPYLAEPDPTGPGGYPIAPAEYRARAATPTPFPAPLGVRPEAPSRPSRLPWIIALVAVGLAAGAGVMLYMNMQKSAAPPAPATPAVVMHPDPPPQQPVVTAPIDAAIVARAADVAPVLDKPTASETPDRPKPASTTPVKPSVAAVTPPDKHAPPSRPPPIVDRPSGPPGFITIDSAPVYAVISIDGKQIGETPLVHISLAPGKHAVRAVSPSGTARTVSITIEPGKTAPTRRIEW